MKAKIDNQTSILKLAFPIFIEIFLFMMMGNIDTFMLSQYSDIAVAAVGNANQILNTLNILFNIVALAVGIMIAQYIGANMKKKLNEVYNIAIVANVLLAVIISAGLLLGQSTFFQMVNLPAELYPDTKAYIDTVVSFLFIIALFMTCSTILKSHGLTRVTMYIAICINIINVVGNASFLFGFFGLPVLGVRGVAISTVVSRSIGLLMMVVILVRQLGITFDFRNLWPIPKDTIRMFLKLGLPAAGEPISWQFSQMVIFSFINMMGTMAVTTRVYASLITWFAFLGCLAIAQASQIVVGHLVGAKKFDDAYHLVLRSLVKALAVTVTVSIVFSIFREQLLGIFTDLPDVITLGGWILIIDIILEIGRSMNLVLIGSLKAAGDVNFPVAVGIVSMWTISTGGAYLLGVHFGFGLIGIWIAMALDEIVRGIIMYGRWKSKKWQNKSIT